MMLKERTAALAKNVLPVSLIIILGAAYLSLSYDAVFFAPDEGASLYHFEKASEGAIQHRDFYSVYGMAYYLLGKSLFELFGFSLMVSRTFVLLQNLAIAVLIYCIGVRLMNAKFAFISALAFVVCWGDPFIVTPIFIYPAQVSQFLGLLSVLLILNYNRGNRSIYIFLAGMACGISSLFKPNVGLFNLLALFLFFFLREMLLNLSASQRECDDNNQGFNITLGKIGIIVELCGIVFAVMVLYKLFAQFGLTIITFVYTLLPFYLTTAYLLFLGVRVLQAKEAENIFWKNHKEAMRSYVLLGAGFAICQLAQFVYFAGNGALKDFLGMLSTATGYYNLYALPLWQGGRIIALTAATLAAASLLNVLVKATSDRSPSWKIALIVVIVLVSVVIPLSIYLGLGNPLKVHFLTRAVLMSFSLFVCLYIMSGEPLTGSITITENLTAFSLITILSATMLLDAFPKVDPGHIVMVMPPFFILFGVLAQRFYDLWIRYLSTAFPRAGRRIAAALTYMLILGILSPSLFMMFAFTFVITPSPDGRGFQLYNGTLVPVPRSSVGVDRAKGLEIGTLSWPPLKTQRILDFFEVVRRVSAITREGDKLFSTMPSALMLYFLTDRDSVSNKANCYVWQTTMGTTTSELIRDFSDLELVRIIGKERPRVIISEAEAAETKLFEANWPVSWNFIKANYRVAETVGPFEIYVPSR